MAKEKKSSEATVEERLNNLYALQQTLSSIDEIKTLRGELPLEVEDLEDEVKGLETRREGYEADIKEIEHDIARFHNQREENLMSIQKLTEQQQDVRNNREFDFLSKEIEFKQLDNQLLDKKIRGAYEEIKKCEYDINHCEKLIDERAADLEVKRAELDKITNETKKDEELLRLTAQELEAKIDERLLYSFSRIRSNVRNGLGIVYVQRDACGGCFNRIPPQRQLDIRSRKKIIVCEYCGRILIDPELAGVSIEEPADKKPKRRATRKTRKSTEA